MEQREMIRNKQQEPPAPKKPVPAPPPGGWRFSDWASL
jgi:hypothetical protein